MPMALERAGRESHRIVNMTSGQSLSQCVAEVVHTDAPSNYFLELPQPGTEIGLPNPVSKGDE